MMQSGSEGAVMDEGVVGAFAGAAEWFLHIASQDEVAARWQEPSALVGYTIGGAVAHTTAAIAWLRPLLDTTPGTDAPRWSVADYLTPFPVRSPEDLDASLHMAARAQGERAAERGAKEIVARLHSLVDGLVERLAAEDPNRLVDLRPTLPAAIRLEDFLRTRVVELLVHGDDVAASVNVAARPPGDAAMIAIGALLTVAVKAHGHVEVLRALARRERSTGGVFPVL
jgi:hypothetical protein